MSRDAIPMGVDGTETRFVEMYQPNRFKDGLEHKWIVSKWHNVKGASKCVPGVGCTLHILSRETYITNTQHNAIYMVCEPVDIEGYELYQRWEVWASRVMPPDKTTLVIPMMSTIDALVWKIKTRNIPVATVVKTSGEADDARQLYSDAGVAAKYIQRHNDGILKGWEV